MSRLTVFLARSIGLFTVLLVVAFLTRGSAIIETTVADRPVMLVYAITSLAMGIAMVLGHNVWSGGALPVAVTLVGWLILAKGLLLLFLAQKRCPECSSRCDMPSTTICSRACARDWALSDLGRIHSADLAQALS